MATPHLSEIATTTIKNYSRVLADNVSDNTALLKRLKARGKVKPVDGGETILQELEYAENSTVMRYSGGEVLNVQPSEVFTAAEYNLQADGCRGHYQRPGGVEELGPRAHQRPAGKPGCRMPAGR